MASGINGLGDYAGDYSANTSVDNLDQKINSKDYSTASADELMEACKEFESYFVEQMVKSMKKMIPESDEESSAGSSYLDYFGDTLTQEIAASATENSDFGIAQMLYEQMKRNYNITE